MLNLHYFSLFQIAVVTFPDFDSLKIPFFLRSDNQYIVKSADFSG